MRSEGSQTSHRDLARDVGTRADLVQYLSLGTSDQYRVKTEDDEVRQPTPYVKAYLLESHLDISVDNEGILGGVFDSIVSLSDPSLVRVETKDERVFFVDSSIPRFKILHTIEKASEGDAVFKKLTDGSIEGIDRCWLPSRFLDTMDRGVLTGFGMVFSSAPINLVDTMDEEFIDSETGEIIDVDPQSAGFRLAFSGGLAARYQLERLRKSDAFHGQKALSHVEIALRDSERASKAFVDTIYSSGKIIGYGLGVERHLTTATSILDRYGALLSRWEEDYSLGWKAVGDLRYHSGTPFIFYFPSPLSSLQLEKLVDFVFSAQIPFRLFGIPLSRGDGRVDVDAIDLHTGDRVRFEVTREFIRLYLPSGTCANAVTRFWRNFETVLAAETSVVVGSETDPIRDIPDAN